MVVRRARCWGWQISVRSMGEEICASEFPKPSRARPPMKAAQTCQSRVHYPSLVVPGSRTAQVLASGLHHGANNHDDAAYGDGKLATKVVGEDGTVKQRVSIGPFYQTRLFCLGRKVTYTIGMETKLPIWYRAPRRPSLEPCGSSK